MKFNFYILSILILSTQSLNMTAQGIIIPSGAYITASNGNIVVKNNFVNNGSFTANGGTMIFNGTAQTIGGSSASIFNNLTTITGSTTTFSSTGQKLTGILLSNGTVNANGNLTLLSTAAQTAAIDGSGTGSVTGNLTMQRYIASGFGYKYFSSPFTSDTVGDFSNDISLAASFPVFYRHDENLASTGWISYTAGSGVLTPLQGYAANLGSATAAKTIDLKGVVNNGTVSRTLYNHNMTYTKGFNLVGNPYPSPINWDAAGGWTKTNIDNAVYYFNAGITDAYTGVYSSYVNGVSSDGIAGSTIAAMQGFFVHVSNGSFPVSGLLSVNNTARVLNSTAKFFRVYGQGSHPLFRFTASFAEKTNLADPITIYFSDDASGKNFNKDLDALKLMNTEAGIPNFFALSADAEKLSIRAMAILHDTIINIPLGLVTPKSGLIVFSIKDMMQLPASTDIFFYDQATGINQDLKKDSTCRLLLPAGDYENRFFLKLGWRGIIAGTGSNNNAEGFTAYGANGKLFVKTNLAEGERGSLAVTNMIGQLIYKQEIGSNISGPLSINCASGVYIVNFSGGTKKYSKKIFVGNP